MFNHLNSLSGISRSTAMTAGQTVKVDQASTEVTNACIKLVCSSLKDRVLLSNHEVSTLFGKSFSISLETGQI